MQAEQTNPEKRNVSSDIYLLIEPVKWVRALFNIIVAKKIQTGLLKAQVGRMQANIMTIQYSDNYFKILAHWKGSAWKAVWKELLIWLILFYAVKVGLEFGLPSSLHSDAHKIIGVFYKYTDKVPLQFLLGFFVGQLLSRWWQQVEHLPWPDDIMAWVAACLPEDDPDSNLRRRLVARYLVLSETLVLRNLSTRVRKRYPNEEQLVSVGLMTEEELKLYQGCPCPNARWQLPLQWALNGVLVPLNSREHNPVTLAAMGHLVNTVNTFRSGLRQLFLYNWISLPLVYTQTVSVVVYGYFALCLIGHQAFGEEEEVYVPVLTILQFVFYVGWFKVAQDLMLPFGDDDDDIPANFLLDRHLAVALTLANYGTTAHPPLIKNCEAADKTGNEDDAFTLANKNAALTGSNDRPPKLLATVRTSGRQTQSNMSHKMSLYDSILGRRDNQQARPEARPGHTGASPMRTALRRLCGHVPKETIYF